MNKRDEDRRLAARIRRTRYRQTDKGIASQKKYEACDKYKKVVAKYARSEKGKLSRHKWRTSENGKAFYRDYYQKNKLSHNVKIGIARSLRGNKNGAKWTMLVDYTIEELKKHLEGQFKEGMTWKNQGEWHIDHIVPIAAFNFTKSTHLDFKKCWSLSNLQPLWACENHKKNNKLDKPFQPGLLLECA